MFIINFFFIKNVFSEIINDFINLLMILEQFILTEKKYINIYKKINL